jgi:ribosomal protein S12 methylthiotransferase
MAKLPIISDGADSASCAPVMLNITADAAAGLERRNYRGNAAIITLGCAKNQVDSEVMLGALKNYGFDIVSELKDADVAIVNTCGFLESAVRESIDSILGAADYKKTGRLRRLLVSGCMVERYKGELEKTIPEVDGFLTTSDLLRAGEAAAGAFEEMLDPAARPYFLYDDEMPRVLASKSHTAYMKISEGCNRPCTFCIIPRIRGKMRSRTINSLVREVAMLGEQGIKEVNLVAQDLTAFGADTGEGDIVDLLTKLDAAKAVDWIRLLYAYPLGINDRLLRAIVDLPTVCNYLDLPLQHASEKVLAAMKRPLGRFSPKSIVKQISTVAPEIALRTTFIVGFPGETDEDVAELEELVLEGHFTNVGVFTYSREQGTPSYDLPAQVPEAAKKSRRARIMKAQQKVNAKRLNLINGSTQKVILEGPHPETELLLLGRTYFQAPDVDGTVIINSVADHLKKVEQGAFYEVKITDIRGYDLMGEVVAAL